MSSEKHPQKAPGGLWQKTATPNLVRNSSSGTFYARFRLDGKLRWRSLETTVFTTAKLRLADVLTGERKLVAAGDGQITFAQAAKLYRERVAADPELKPRSKVDHEQRFARLMKVLSGTGRTSSALRGVARRDRERLQADRMATREEVWAAWGTRKIRAITAAECKEWVRKLREAYPGATVFNQTLSCLRTILDIGVENGARFDNPAKPRSKAVDKELQRRPELPKPLRLPEPAQFEAFIAAVEASGSGWSRPPLRACGLARRGL